MSFYLKSFAPRRRLALLKIRKERTGTYSVLGELLLSWGLIHRTKAPVRCNWLSRTATRSDDSSLRKPMRLIGRPKAADTFRVPLGSD